MGFTIDVTTQDGVAHEAAYFKVSDVRFNHTKAVCQFRLEAWTNKVARDSEKASLRGVQKGTVPISAQYRARNGVSAGFPPAKSVDQFDDGFSLTLQDKANNNLIKLCYVFAKAQIIEAGILEDDITDIDPDVLEGDIKDIDPV